MKFPEKCHKCGSRQLDLVVDNGQHESSFSLENGKITDTVDHNNTDSEELSMSIYCNICDKTVYESEVNFKETFL